MKYKNSSPLFPLLSTFFLMSARSSIILYGQTKTVLHATIPSDYPHYEGSALPDPSSITQILISFLDPALTFSILHHCTTGGFFPRWERLENFINFFLDHFYTLLFNSVYDNISWAICCLNSTLYFLTAALIFFADRTLEQMFSTMLMYGCIPLFTVSWTLGSYLSCFAITFSWRSIIVFWSLIFFIFSF